MKNNVVAKSGTEVWMRSPRHGLVEVVVVGPDERILSSVEHDLREAAGAGADVDNENPHNVPVPGKEWAWVGFSAVVHDGDVREFMKKLVKVASGHSWVSFIRWTPNTGWPHVVFREKYR